MRNFVVHIFIYFYFDRMARIYRDKNKLHEYKFR